MRVIAGEFRSRSLVAPPGTATRPTSDRLRETLFNVLRDRVQGAQLADLFAGSGAVGIEALSRGAAHCTFVEQGREALVALRSNLATLGLSARATVEARSVSRVLAAGLKRSVPLDLVFLDPPYQQAAAYSEVLTALGQSQLLRLGPDALVIAEHARRDHLLVRYGALQRTRELQQGDAALSFFSLSAEEPAPGATPARAVDGGGAG